MLRPAAALCATPNEALLANLALGATFVGALYFGNLGRAPNRDDPDVVVHRFARIAAVSALAPTHMLILIHAKGTDLTIPRSCPPPARLERWLGLAPPSLHLGALAVALPLLLTVTLFAGPLVQRHLDGDGYSLTRLRDSFSRRTTRLILLRNLLVGPFAEEWVFRACMCPLFFSAGFSDVANVFATALIFAAAHLHHWLDAGSPPIVLVVQFLYTSLFGAYSSYLFLRTGLLYGPFAAHVFCNSVGLPDFGKVLSHERPRLVAYSYLAGIVGFVAIVALDAAWRPPIFGSMYWLGDAL